MQNLDDEVAESHFLLTALGCSVPPCDVNSKNLQESRGVEQAHDRLSDVPWWRNAVEAVED